MYDVECTPLFVCSLSKGEGEEGEKKRVRERESSANLAEPFEMCTKHTVSTEGHALTCISACHRFPFFLLAPQFPSTSSASGPYKGTAAGRFCADDSTAGAKAPVLSIRFAAVASLLSPSFFLFL